MSSSPGPRPSKCPVMRTWNMLFFVLTYLVAGVRGYAATSLSSLSLRLHVSEGSRAVMRQQPQLHPPLTPRCASTVLRCGAARAALQRSEQHWRCGGGKGSSGRRRCHSPQCMAGEEADSGLDSELPVLILGAGWVGSRVAQSLIEDGVPTVVTNRPGTDVAKKPPYFRPLELPDCATEPRPCATRCEFDLNEPSTWEGLPAASSISGVIVTFPMVSPQSFWDSYLAKVSDLGRPILCYSTTSVYQVDTPGQVVDEETPLRETPRTVGEQYVQDRGATVLTISGIFGDQRTPRAICTCLSTYTSAGGAVRTPRHTPHTHWRARAG